MALLLFKPSQGCTPCESSCARVWIWIRGIRFGALDLKLETSWNHEKKDPFWSDNPGLQVFLECCISLKVLTGVNSQDTVAVTAWASCVIARVGCWKTHFSSWFSFSRIDIRLSFWVTQFFSESAGWFEAISGQCGYHQCLGPSHHACHWWSPLIFSPGNLAWLARPDAHRP